MGAEQRRTRPDMSGIPELQSDTHHEHGLAETLEQMGRGVINAFTVERDTSLAEGAGAPGSTDVGGLARDDSDERDERERER